MYSIFHANKSVGGIDIGQKFVYNWGDRNKTHKDFMTNDQEKTIVNLYKKGQSYREISLETGIPSDTCASMMRRKYKHLQRLMEMKRMRDTPKKIKKIEKDLGLKEYQAEALFHEMKARYDNKKVNCKRNGVEFTILLEEIEFPTHCPYLGTPLNYYQTLYTADDYPTFDRIDNTRGYVKDNVAIVSWRANRIKNNSTAAELRAIANAVDKLLEHSCVTPTVET